MHLEVFYIGGNTGWGLALFDEEGNQQGEAAYHWRKAHALTEARTFHADLPCHVFGRDGNLQRII